MIVLYSDARDLRHRIEGLFADSRVRSTDSRLEFESLAAAASVGIAGLRSCSDADVAWLETVFGQGLAGPSCIVVTPLSLPRLQRLRAVESNRFHVVWTQEVVMRLRQTLGQVDLWHRDPLRLLGRRMLHDRSLHWSLVKAIEHTCKLSSDTQSDPPANSVTNLANEIDIGPEAFSRYWRQEIPLRCGPKQLLSWALLMWAVRQRPEAGWPTIATQAGVRRRTLERCSVRLLGCTLSAAGRDPALLKRRFRQWVAEVSKLDRPMVSHPCHSRKSDAVLVSSANNSTSAAHSGSPRPEDSGLRCPARRGLEASRWTSWLKREARDSSRLLRRRSAVPDSREPLPVRTLIVLRDEEPFNCRLPLESPWEVTSMKIERMGMTVLAAFGLALLPACAAESPGGGMGSVSAGPVIKGGDDRTGEYDAVPGWWKPAPDHVEPWAWGQVSGVAVDNPDRVIVGIWGDRDADGLEREGSTNYVVAVDRDGNITENWSQWDSIFNKPHQLYISPYDPERHVWIVERGGGKNVNMQVFKFSNDGSELLMRLVDPDHPTTRAEARANPHPDPYEYGDPAVMAFLPNGDFLLGDGYWHSRIIRYNAEGEYLMEWGELGSGPGQFDLIHGLAVDRNRRVYVGDRTNNRVQIFTEDGEYIDEWPDISDPVGVFIDENDAVWVVSAMLNRILKYNMDGELQYYLGTFGGTRGGFAGGLSRPHQIDVDNEGNLYIASWDGGWMDKYIPRADADPSKLVGRKLVLEN